MISFRDKYVKVNMSCLELTQALTSNKTQGGSDLVTPKISPCGTKAFLTYQSATNFVSDLPSVIFAIYPIDCGRILYDSPLFEYTATEQRALSVYLLTAVISPCFTRIITATVFQNYANPADPNNTFVTNTGVDTVSSTNGYRHDVILTVVSIARDYRSTTLLKQVVLEDIYLAPVIFTITWNLEEYVTIIYPLGQVALDTDPTPMALEVRDSSSLDVIASDIIPIVANNPVLFKLKSCGVCRLYIALSGAAGNLNPPPVPDNIASFTNIQGPSFVGVYSVDTGSGTIILTDSYSIRSFSRWIDVRITNDDEAQIINSARLPQSSVGNGYLYQDFTSGVDPVILQLTPGSSVDSSVQLLEFKNSRLRLLDELVLNVPAETVVGFVPCSNFVLVSTSLPLGSYVHVRVYEIVCGNYGLELQLVTMDTPVTGASLVSFTKDGTKALITGVNDSSLQMNNILLFEICCN